MNQARFSAVEKRFGIYESRAVHAKSLGDDPAFFGARKR
jgi:hypothetical protein